MSDPIVAEVRRHRRELADRFGHDLKKIVEYLRKREKEGGRTVVKAPPRCARG
jgi:hypothetical protein